MTYFFPPVTVQYLLHLLKPEDGVLDPEEQGSLPVNGTCHRRVILIQWGVVMVSDKEFIHDVDLESNRVYSVSGEHCHLARKYSTGG